MTKECTTSNDEFTIQEYPTTNEYSATKGYQTTKSDTKEYPTIKVHSAITIAVWLRIFRE